MTSPSDSQLKSSIRPNFYNCHVGGQPFNKFIQEILLWLTGWIINGNKAPVLLFQIYFHHPTSEYSLGMHRVIFLGLHYVSFFAENNDEILKVER